jgi:hypothetical protein
MRQAADFLMALQLTGAAKNASLANLQVRLPAVVIGGGLTGIDTATEVQAYYIKQVEKTLLRYEQLVASHDDKFVRQGLDESRSWCSTNSWRRQTCARRTRAGEKGETHTRFHRADTAVGRRDRSLPAQTLGVARLPAQSRGSDQGHGGRHLLRRTLSPVAAAPTRSHTSAASMKENADGKLVENEEVKSRRVRFWPPAPKEHRLFSEHRAA